MGAMNQSRLIAQGFFSAVAARNERNMPKVLVQTRERELLSNKVAIFPA
jgi:hypothetical protein